MFLVFWRDRCSPICAAFASYPYPEAQSSKSLSSIVRARGIRPESWSSQSSRCGVLYCSPHIQHLPPPVSSLVHPTKSLLSIISTTRLASPLPTATRAELLEGTILRFRHLSLVVAIAALCLLGLCGALTLLLGRRRSNQSLRAVVLLIAA